METTLISTALTLLSLSAGMFLLAKTNRDVLGKFFKIISVFIIIASFLNLGGTALHCAMRVYMHHYHYEMMHERDGMGPEMGMMHMRYAHEMRPDGFHGKEGCCYEECCEKDGHRGMMEKEMYHKEMKDSSEVKRHERNK